MIFGLFNFLFKIFEKGVFLVLLNDYLLRNHQKIHNEIIITIAYNMIYVYSYCQIKCKKGVSYIEKNCPLVLKDYLIKILKNSENIENIENNIATIEFIKDNKPVYFSTKSILKEIDFEVPDYDFIIYRDNNTRPTNIKYISYKTKDELKNEEIYAYEKSNIRFMMVELLMNDKTYIIELLNNKYNFYIKDNIFDKQFFIYYLHNLYNSDFDKPHEIIEYMNNMDEISLKIIDHNVDIKKIEFTTDPRQYICLGKDSYEISTKL
jgi:hypothetical protein